ncbi:MAG: AgmX/PglI C-terminal domain-containing protein [Pseudomonadota bacterium]
MAGHGSASSLSTGSALLSPLFLFPLAVSACGGTTQREPARLVTSSASGEERRGAPPSPADSDDNESTETDADGMQVEGLPGTVDPESARATIERAYPAIIGCYRRETVEARFVGGAVEIALRIAVDGSVRKAQISGGDLGAWPVEKCILRVIRSVRFRRPRGGGEAEFSVPLELSHQGNVVDMDEGPAQIALMSHLSSLSVCSKAGTAPDKSRIVVYVGPGGVVKSAGFVAAGALPLDEAWADCAHARALTWRFTDPRGMVLKVKGWYSSP